MSVGNDVVDLADAESRLHGLHPRWGERVFAASERAELDASPSSARHRLHWALWAAKESAYKARKRGDPETVFSPREFVVELSPLPGASGIAVGRVVHRGDAFAVEVRLDDTCVHAVATGPDAAGVRVLSGVGTARWGHGVAVRRLATEALGSALQLDPGRLQIGGRPPAVRDGGRPLDATVSLSHHGRFVAFACALRGARRRTTA